MQNTIKPFAILTNSPSLISTSAKVKKISILNCWQTALVQISAPRITILNLESVGVIYLHQTIYNPKINYSSKSMHYSCFFGSMKLILPCLLFWSFVTDWISNIGEKFVEGKKNIIKGFAVHFQFRNTN